jgi:PBS lyase HEAT-like repeat
VGSVLPDGGNNLNNKNRQSHKGRPTLELPNYEVWLFGYWESAMKARMDIPMRTIVSVGCLILVLAVVVAESFAAKAAREVEVHFRFQTTVLTLHEPVVGVFEVQNRMTKPIVVNVGATVREFFDLSLTTPNGQVLHKDPYEGQVDIVTYGAGKVTVEPGGEYKETLVMNRWFPFQSEGTYSLASKLTSPIETADGDFQAGRETSKLLINSRDPVKLKTVCTELARQAEIATTVDAAQFPTMALSYVNDPVAVPFLGRLLSTNTLAYRYAVAGLERIGDDDAIEVLLSALNAKWGDIPELATASLARMQDRIANPRLKETVKKAVERTSEQARNKFIKTQIAYLDYQSPQLQTAAIQNLATVKDGLLQAEPILQRLANDPNQPSEVTTAAKEALQRLHLRP